MSHLLASKSELVSEFDSTDFVAKTCHQINKDLLGFSQLTVSIDGPDQQVPFDQLIYQLDAIIQGLSKDDRLAQFVYRVDLNEREFQQALQDSTWDNLAFLILRREAQKVYLKQKFSSNSSF